MSYVVLARKWRPQQFADVLGQDHVSRTITNALNSGRLAHAFLFSGPRGVGKTSAARILAKALCCEAQDGPTATPCGKCSQCLEITEGRSTDVFEIDAASHTGVDNVREIIDNVRYLPSSARYKIYVIDEVHMLSTGAFNALLKTLEEPPEHVKFILATTDIHKVPVTILSRVQRYNFRLISLSAISERLSQMLKADGIEHDLGALSLVAKESGGSMRDAQSLLEQILAYVGDRALDGEVVREALGMADATVVNGCFTALLHRKPAEVLEFVSQVHERGLSLARFGDALIEQARDLMVARLMPKPETVLELPSDEIQRLTTLAQSFEASEFERLFEQLCRVAEDVGRSAHPRYALEVGLAALAAKPAQVPLDQVLGALERVEANLAGRPLPPPQTTALPTAAAPVSAAPTIASAESPTPVPETAAPKASSVPAPPPPEPQAAPSGPAPQAPAPSSEPVPPGKSYAQGDRVADFSRFVRGIQKQRPALGATLAQVRPLAFAEDHVELACETPFDQAKLKDRDTREYLEAQLKRFFGKAVELQLQHGKVGSAKEPPPQTLLERHDSAQQAKREKKAKTASSSPAVKALKDQLGAQISRMNIIEEES